MTTNDTALILIGYQNDYFGSNGILREVVRDSARITGILKNTLALVDQLSPTPLLIVSTPIVFTNEYDELVNPVGILKTIKDVGAFRQGCEGSRTIPEIRAYGDRILNVPGKRGLNAFSNTSLNSVLRKHNITHAVIAGTVTSICVDSTARAAQERGFQVSVLSDCTSARTPEEQEFYCREILPLYCQVLTHRELLERIGAFGERVDRSGH